MKFDQPPKDISESPEEISSAELINNHEEKENKIFQEKYRTEILPLIEILKPEDISFEEYENQVLDDLIESVKKIQVAQGRLIENPEKTLDEAKALLVSRLNAGIKDTKNKKENLDFALKSEAALIISGKPHNAESIEGQYFYRDNHRAIGEKIIPLFEKAIKDSNFQLVESLLDKIDESAKSLAQDSQSLYHSCTPRYGGGNWAEEDQKAILLGRMPYWAFERYKSNFEENEISKKLIPKEHYERNFIKNIIRDNDVLHRLGLFQDYQINNDLDKKIHDLANKSDENLSILKDNEIHVLSETLKQKAKENFSAFNRGSRANRLFDIFTKNDFEELIKSDVGIESINPSQLPRYLDKDISDYLVSQWKEKLKKGFKIEIESEDGHSYHGDDIFRHFTVDDFKELSKSGVIINPSRVPFYKLKEFKEGSLYLFDAFKSIHESKQEAFIKKIASTRFFNLIENMNFNEVETNNLIGTLKDSSQEEAKKYLEIKFGIQEGISNLSNGNTNFIENKEIRDKIFDEIQKSFSYIGDENEISVKEKKIKLQNIQESFWIMDNRDKLPKQILEILKKFEDQYGNKGKHLIALAISAYGTENPENFSVQMKIIEEVLNKYNSETIPQGAHVSMGIEYEATSSINESYTQDSILGYKKAIELVSRSANIGKGTGGVHEIATKPTYNPYILLAEIKLLQDAGFLDFNFEKYPHAPRGYHLSLVGESGLAVNEDAYFLNNLLTMTQLTGILAGKNIHWTKDIHKKSFDIFENNKQKGERVEIKGMGCDSIEQFEKAIITAHHAGIAIQLCNKYLREIIQFPEVPATAEDFEQMLVNTNLLTKSFESDNERDIVYEWIRLKGKIVDAIGQHNDSFVDSEFSGFVLDKNGNYIDTSEHIDVVRNKKLIDQEKLQSLEFQDQIHLSIQDLYISQQIKFVNALINTNNIFLKPPQANENSPVNAKAVLDTLKRENYNGIVSGDSKQSIFENKGELRDGYYYIQGASEEMISHKSQILLNRFNNAMEKLLKGASRNKIRNRTSILNA
ncbi:MAG: hypothetical protein V4665_02665 [Patescibacteria group bacterium]